MIDLTQIIIAFIGVLGTIITGFVIPSLLQYLKEKNITISDKTLELLRKIAKDAVEYAQEEFWNSDETNKKREEAFKFVKERLLEYGITFDDELIGKMISSAVQAYIRNNNILGGE